MGSKEVFLRTRISGLLVLEVRRGNPNGSPDDGNRPRTFDRGSGAEYGFVTPMCLKRKIRNCFVDHQSACFLDLVEKLKLDAHRFQCYESKERGFAGATPQEAARKARELAMKDEAKFLDSYWDYRLMGGMLLEQNSDKKEKKEKEDEKKARFTKTGCFTISPAVSISPVSIVEVTVAKTAINDEGDKANQQTLGPMAYKFVDHALYVAEFSINPLVAHKTRLTQQDVEVLKEIWPIAFTVDESVARPAGSIRPLHIWWREHTNSTGSFNETEFWNNLRPVPKGSDPSTSLSDYQIPDGKKFGAKDLMDRFGR